VVNSRFLQANAAENLPTGYLWWFILARLEVLVGRLADPWCYGWSRQLLSCRGLCGGKASVRGARRVATWTRS